MGNVHKANDLGIGNGLWLKIVTWLGIAFLFLPLPVLIFYSFNAGSHVTHWEGFSLKWYAVTFADRTLWLGIRNSLVIAVASTALSTVLGTSAALAVGKYAFRGRQLFQNLIYLPITLPEIIFGLALLSLFIAIRMPLGMTSVICAHVTFSISFVALIVLAKLHQLDPRLEEASLDLGATRRQTFFKVVLPVISPGIISGALFAFTLSLDDFVITLFTAGADSTTLPLKIYSLIKYGVTPELNAISTVLIVATVLVIWTAQRLQKSKAGIKSLGKAGFAFAGCILSLLILSNLVADDTKVINLYIYSDYIDAGVLADFERETGIRIKQSYYNDNEELLARLSMGVSDYDLIVPSDFMVEVLIKQGLLSPIDFKNIPNYAHVDERFGKLSYDLTGSYYVPYTYGFSGIIYNSDTVREPVESWSVLWDPRYAKKILMLDDMREAFGVALKLLGFSLKDKDLSQIRQAKELLLKQKPLLLKYESNNVESYLLSNDAIVAHIWSGSALRLQRNHPRFKLVVPREGVLMFVDNFCIPKHAPHKKNAEAFLDYLLRPEVTARNMASLFYPMPNKDALAYLDPAAANALMPLLNLDLSKLELPGDLGELAQELDKAWTSVRAK